MYSSAYKRSHGPEHVKELSRMIDVHHNEFLAADGLEKKAEALRLLRGYAAEFLYQVRHDYKFRLPETERVLSQSVSSIADFDPREASIAFEELSKYTHNLLDQPWRKEFHRIQLTCGFFMHNIKAHLQNAQEMLIVLGYVGTDDQTLELARPADPVVLKALSRDCFIASQECLILSQIWERVQGEIPDYPLTVFEAYHTRKRLIGDTTTIVKSLVYEARERQHKMREEIEKQERYEKLLAIEAEKKLKIEAQSHLDARRVQHGFVPVDRLIDIDDSRTETERDIVERVLKNTEKQNEGSYRRLYSAEGPSTSTSRKHSSGTSAASISSGSSLRELDEVYYDECLNTSPKASGLMRPESIDIDDLVEKHKKTVDRVDAVLHNPRRSEPAPRSTSKSDQLGRYDQFGRYYESPPATVSSFYSNPYVNGTHSQVNAMEVRSRINGNNDDTTYSLIHDAPTTALTNSKSSELSAGYSNKQVETQPTPSSSFKSLKHHQDLPKASAAPSNGTGGGFLSKMSGLIGMGSKSEKSASSSSGHKEPKTKPSALTKTKVPVESDYYDLDVNETGSFVNLVPPKSSLALDQLYQIDSVDPDDDLDGNRPPRSPYEKELMRPNLNTNPDYVKLSSDKDIGFSRPTSGASGISNSKQVAKVEPWDCIHCTFHNELHTNICEMCSKTKDFVPVGLMLPEAAAASPSPSPDQLLNSSGEWTKVKGRKKSKGQVQVDSKTTRSYPSSCYPTKVTVVNETDSSKTNGHVLVPEHPLVECCNCTLLNPVGIKHCEACNERLSYPEYNGTLT